MGCCISKKSDSTSTLNNSKATDKDDTKSPLHVIKPF